MKSEPITCCYQCYLLDSLRAFDGCIIEDICSYLFPTELKSLGDAASMTRSVLKSSSDEVKWCLQNIVRWHRVGGEARICIRDASVALSSGSWYPGGVALADLRITSDCNLSFRFEVAFSGMLGGDVMLGLTRSIVAAPFVGSSAAMETEEPSAAMEAGYEYIVGRGSAPASIFVGAGSATQCCFSPGNGTGPRVDSLSEGVRFECIEMCRIGEWLEFECRFGEITATDVLGNVFRWATKIEPDEIWQPTFAWTGTTASIRIVQRKRCEGCEKCAQWNHSIDSSCAMKCDGCASHGA
mmetsp:Transcript_120629/g.212802  ORF Transcript_120629/g.212802 Transcript_120629/m.212802 type:complete len:297 (-) Transcript_120629:128-1018(-)